MNGDVEIREGDAVDCDGCGFPSRVRTYHWDADVQVVECPAGYRIVGINGRRVQPWIVVDCRTLDAECSGTGQGLVVR
jgi:hypothetical protein